MINVTDPRTQHVLQGQLHLSDDPHQVLVSILGSCVAACVRDPVLRLGGMNHFLLPGKDPGDNSNLRYGARNMEDLINALLRKGADRRRLEVYLCGGANVLGSQTGIGASNSSFAKEFVRTEGFKLRGTDLGGCRGRRVKFHPFSGKVEMSLMQVAPVEKPVPPSRSGPDIELF